MRWKQASLLTKAEYLPLLNKLEPIYRFLPETTIIDEMPLPFYPDGKLLRLLRAPSFPKPLWYVKIKNEIVPLDGSIANINYLDETAPLHLTPETSAAHSRFRDAFGNNVLPEKFDL